VVALIEQMRALRSVCTCTLVIISLCIVLREINLLLLLLLLLLSLLSFSCSNLLKILVCSILAAFLLHCINFVCNISYLKINMMMKRSRLSSWRFVDRQTDGYEWSLYDSGVTVLGNERVAYRPIQQWDEIRLRMSSATSWYSLAPSPNQPV